MRIDLARTDPDVNMDRFYHVELTDGLFDVAGVERVWGRRGTRGRHRVDWYTSHIEAVSAMSALVTEKRPEVMSRLARRAIRLCQRIGGAKCVVKHS